MAVLLATAASIAVKVGLCAFAADRTFARGVAATSAALLAAAGGITALLAAA